MFPALRSAPCLANWTTASAGVGLSAVTRFLVAAWARAGGRDMPVYWWLGDLPSVTYGCAVLSPSPPWSRWLWGLAIGTWEVDGGGGHANWRQAEAIPGPGRSLCPGSG